MRRIVECAAWVVYVSSDRSSHGRNVVCEQGEWDAMELSRPGYHALIRSGIANEGEAERLARGTSGDAKKRGSREEARTS